MAYFWPWSAKTYASQLDKWNDLSSIARRNGLILISYDYFSGQPVGTNEEVRTPNISNFAHRRILHDFWSKPDVPLAKPRPLHKETDNSLLR